VQPDGHSFWPGWQTCSGIGLCEASPGLSLAGPPGVSTFEQAWLKPSHTPSQLLSWPSHVSLAGVWQTHAP